MWKHDKTPNCHCFAFMNTKVSTVFSLTLPYDCYNWCSWEPHHAGRNSASIWSALDHFAV